MPITIPLLTQGCHLYTLHLLKKTTMDIQEIQPINFLFFRAETTLAELANFFSVAKDLFREAVQHDLHITGPIHWHYVGFNGDATKPFILEISLPVSDVVPNYDGPFHFKRTEPFRCVSIFHSG